MHTIAAGLTVPAIAAAAVAVATPIAVGVFAARRSPSERFGRQLVLVGLLMIPVTLCLSSDPVAYAIGRVARWILEPAVVWLVLAFPSGRVTGRADRTILTIAVLVAGLLYLPSALLVHAYPVPLDWVTCGAHCPANAFQVVHPEPGFVSSVLRPVREILTVGVFVAVIVRVAMRIRAATPLSRKTLGPVLAIAIARALLLSVVLVARRAAPDSGGVAVADWALAMTIPAFAVGFLVGLARWWLFVDASLRRLVGRLHRPMTPDRLRIVLAEAFEDPSLTVSYPLPGGGWLDPSGEPAAAPERRPGRGVTDIRDGGRLVAVLTHDPALDHEQAFVDAASSFARPALEIQRLGASVSMARHELDDAQERMAGVADRERRRIERDLHDGVQQRLVALAIRLELAAEQIDADPAGAQTLIRHLGTEVDIALRDVSSLGREAGPPLLGRLGLRAALGVAARAAPISTTLSAAPAGRYPPAVESAVYFSALEALRNAAQQGGDATAVHISLREHDDALWLEVSDDGVAAGAQGPADPDDGLAEFRRRIAAVGGSSDVRSSPGGGTTVTARFPLAGG